MRQNKTRQNRDSTAFALYEVLIGLAIFAIGILALGRAAQNCLNASTLNATEDRVRQILSNRMAEIQATPGLPDASTAANIDTGYGVVKLVQKSTPAELKDQNERLLGGINVVTLTAEWNSGGVPQSRQIEFYVYRPG
jgi:Tfp pilus assembly protein PilV